MIVKLLDEPFPSIGTSNNVRSPGVHLSDIIRSINKTLGRSKDG